MKWLNFCFICCKRFIENGKWKNAKTIIRFKRKTGGKDVMETYGLKLAVPGEIKNAL